MTPGALPLFPLKSVLFPGGKLELRIFERRYLDLVAECARTSSGFGVCLILQGEEAGAPAEPAAVGTLARIIDFETLPRRTVFKVSLPMYADFEQSLEQL